MLTSEIDILASGVGCHGRLVEAVDAFSNLITLSRCYRYLREGKAARDEGERRGSALMDTFKDAESSRRCGYDCI